MKADGHAECVAALHMIELRAERTKRITLAVDKGYDAEDFVNELRWMPVMAACAELSGLSSAIDGRTTRHEGYGIRQRIRERIEEGFGWIAERSGDLLAAAVSSPGRADNPVGVRANAAAI